MLKYLYVAAFLIILSGCKKFTETNKEEQVAAKTDTLKNANAEGIYEGIFTTNRHESTFLDCSNDNQIYWVDDESKQLEDRYNRMFEVPSVYNSVVVKVRGEIDTTIDLSAAEKYPKTIRVKEVISVEKKNFRNICVSYDFWGLGNEPGWSLEISRKENLIEFLLPGEGKSYYFFYSDPVDENGYIVYRNHNPIQRYLIEIRIRKEPCSDTMSDTVYDYSVEVETSDKVKYKGCGIKGKPF